MIKTKIVPKLGAFNYQFTQIFNKSLNYAKS